MSLPRTNSGFPPGFARWSARIHGENRGVRAGQSVRRGGLGQGPRAVGGGTDAAEAVEALEDVGLVGLVLEGVLDLAQGELQVLLAAHAEGLTHGAVPDAADDLGAGVLLAGLADERAVAHLRQRRLQVSD